MMTISSGQEGLISNEDVQTFDEKEEIYANIHRMDAGIPLPTTKSRVYGVGGPMEVSYSTVSALNPGAARAGPKTKGTISPFPGYQTTTSEGHLFNAAKYRRVGLNDLGGDFSTRRQYVSSLHPAEDFVAGQNVTGPQYWAYKSPLYPVTPPQSISDSLWPPFINSSDATLNALGATAISRCSPTNKPAEGATALLELVKDGLPHLPVLNLLKSRVNSSLSGEYLNYAFGVQPLLRDVSDFTNTVSNADQLISQYERDAGRVVRRGYSFPVEHTFTESLVSSGNYPYFLGPRLTSMYRADVRRTRETYKRQWFSGAFTYTLPTDYYARNEVSRLGALANQLNLDITPEVLWNVAPWSWAVDWFANVGDVLKNMAAFGNQGLVMKYGYIMEHTYVRDTYRYMGRFGSPLGGDVYVPPLTLVTERKLRRRANPFGFGITWNGMSPFQLSIAAALSIFRWL
jgi:hypothetical protein